MKQWMKEILSNISKHNMQHMAAHVFGLDEEMEYDALVYAPSYTPIRLKMTEDFQVTELKESAREKGYLVEKDGLKIAWICTSACAGNLLDYLVLCGELKVKKLIFVGSVGALKPQFDLGDVCTPSYSIAGTMANAYLKESLRDFVPFEKVEPDHAYVDSVIKLAKERGHEIRRASVFCTDSVALEYTHLDEIKSFDTDLIEMETSAFYALADLMEIPAVALLVVSDNSATGIPLVGRTEEQQRKYHHARQKVLPDMIEQIARQTVGVKKLDYKDYFNHLFPGFFEREYIRRVEYPMEELVMDLHAFRAEDHDLSCPEGITFGMYEGELEAVHAAVNEVDDSWTKYFDKDSRIYCAFDGDKVVSFCLVDEFGTYNGLKIGGPGCVGTIPSYRKQGIGLKMVQNATAILQKDGYDISHIHYTGVGPWYARLGYQVVLQWNGKGFI